MRNLVRKVKASTISSPQYAYVDERNMRRDRLNTKLETRMANAQARKRKLRY